MKKSIYQVGAVVILSAFLAACNTDTDEPTTSNAANEEPAETEEVQNEEQPETTETNETDESDDASSDQQEEATETSSEETKAEQEDKADNTTLTYISNGQPFEEKVVTSTSDEMNYTIQHFENYTLTSEEPGVDSLLNNADEATSMQIEVVQKEDVTFDQLKESAKETISAIAPDSTKDLDLASTLEERKEISNIVGYEALLEDEKVVKVVIERENLFVTLTIYDNVQADLTDAFLQMGLTIQ
ncbi:chemotaxis protein [Solibacillus sp. FSL R5-0449]|uniref:chemotaxis protein n=1 Tax=Solibacillus sp. FSL R5-0449 TaxID=2921639 RepID=UPI0030CBFB15